MEKNPFLAQEEPTSLGKILVDILQAIIFALAVNVVIYFLFVVPSQVDGPSMQPNLMDRDLLFADKIVQWLGQTQLGHSLNYDYKRGDIIIFDAENISLVKRIVAGPGDTIRFSGDNYFINGKKITEKYIADSVKTRLPSPILAFLIEDQTITVPADSYFVMGDNRTNSKDSRFKNISFVPRDKIKGRVFFRFWPLARFGILARGEYSEN